MRTVAHSISLSLAPLMSYAITQQPRGTPLPSTSLYRTRSAAKAWF